MAKTITLIQKHSSDELKTILKTSKDEGQKTRLKVILALISGVTRRDTALQLSINSNTITEIVRRYNQFGLESLKTNKGGRKEGNPKWDSAIFTQLAREIDTQNQYWSIPVMMKWIKDTYQVNIPEQTVWYRVNQQGYSYKSSRPHPLLGDNAAQEAFKKGA